MSYATAQVVRGGTTDANALRKWQASACPWEETRHNCFFYGAANAKAAAKLAAKAALPDTTLRAALAGLAGKRIVFLGDSVLRQLYEAALCQMRGHVVVDEAQWADPNRADQQFGSAALCPQGTRHCRLADSCVAVSAGSNAASKWCYRQHERGSGWQQLLAAIKREGEPDVLVFHSGHHGQQLFNTVPEMRGGKAILKRPGRGGAADGNVLKLVGPSVAEQYAQIDAWSGRAALRARAELLARHGGTRLVFQQYEQPHFAGGGAYSSSAAHSGCQPLRFNSTPGFEIERQYVIPQLAKARAIVLETYSLTQRLWWAHSSEAPTPSGGRDCTHWCMPGAPDVWATQLLSALA